MKIKILGTGLQVKDGKVIRKKPAILVEEGNEKILVDCGQPFEQLNEKITKLLVTHPHLNQILGFPDLVKLSSNFEIFGNRDTIEEIKEKFGGEFRKLEKVNSFMNKAKGVLFSKDKFKVSFFPVLHDTAKATTGYIFEDGKQKIVYTPGCSAIKSEYLKDADVWITEPIDEKLMEEKKKQSNIKRIILTSLEEEYKSNFEKLNDNDELGATTTNSPNFDKLQPTKFIKKKIGGIYFENPEFIEKGKMFKLYDDEVALVGDNSTVYILQDKVMGMVSLVKQSNSNIYRVSGIELFKEPKRYKKSNKTVYDDVEILEEPSETIKLLSNNKCGKCDS